ncbi:unnamed protein product, partial [marine sediment metagenome]
MLKGYGTNFGESYGLEIVHEPADDGLTRPGMVTTKAEGIRNLDDVKELRYIFERMIEHMSGAKVKVDR